MIVAQRLDVADKFVTVYNGIRDVTSPGLALPLCI